TAATVRARLALALRLAMAALLVLALLGTGIPQTVDRQATVFVADVSASVADAQPDLAAFIAQAVAAKSPDDAYAVVTTARSAARQRVGAVGGARRRAVQHRRATGVECRHGWHRARLRERSAAGRPGGQPGGRHDQPGVWRRGTAGRPGRRPRHTGGRP